MICIIFGTQRSTVERREEKGDHPPFPAFKYSKFVPLLHLAIFLKFLRCFWLSQKPDSERKKACGCPPMIITFF